MNPDVFYSFIIRTQSKLCTRHFKGAPWPAACMLLRMIHHMSPCLLLLTHLQRSCVFFPFSLAVWAELSNNSLHPCKEVRRFKSAQRTAFWGFFLPRKATSSAYLRTIVTHRMRRRLQKKGKTHERLFEEFSTQIWAHAGFFFSPRRVVFVRAKAISKRESRNWQSEKRVWRQRRLAGAPAAPGCSLCFDFVFCVVERGAVSCRIYQENASESLPVSKKKKQTHAFPSPSPRVRRRCSLQGGLIPTRSVDGDRALGWSVSSPSSLLHHRIQTGSEAFDLTGVGWYFDHPQPSVLRRWPVFSFQGEGACNTPRFGSSDSSRRDLAPCGGCKGTTWHSVTKANQIFL